MAEDTTSRDVNGADPDQQAELDAVADRLEAALERILGNLDAARPAAEVTARLDRLIGRLRDALGGTAATRD
jgi:hypothetical protein